MSKRFVPRPKISARSQQPRRRLRLEFLEGRDVPASLAPAGIEAPPSFTQTQLVGSDAAANDNAGSSVAVSADGDTAVVGAFDATVGGNEAEGLVYVFIRSGAGWTQQTVLIDPVNTADDLFGTSVALSADGNTLAVGADGTAGTGRAYVFTRSGSTWSLQTGLPPFSGVVAAGDDFGVWVSLSGDGNTLAVGADGSGPFGMDSGKAFVFARSGSATWTQQGGPITASDAHAGDEFGYSLALSPDGNTLAVGADLIGPGKAYVFTRTGAAWTQQTILKDPANTDKDLFGRSLSLSTDGSTLAVGAGGADIFKGGQVPGGNAYVYVRGGAGWALEQALSDPDATVGDSFGASVALSADGNNLAVGAPRAAVEGQAAAGKAYVFVRSRTESTWSQQAALTASDAAAHDQLGFAVSMSADGRTILAGAPFADLPDKVAAGKAYVFVSGTGPFKLGLSKAVGISGADNGQVQTYTFDSNGQLVAAGDVFTPFPGFTGDVRTAVADIDGDGTPDTVYGIGPGGGSQIRVKTSGGLDLSEVVYEAGFTGGVFLAAGDIDGDGRAEIVVSPDQGGGGRVVVFKLENGQLARIADFFGIDDPSFRGGARVAIGDVNGDGTPDIIVAAGFGGGPRVAIFDGRSVLNNGSAPAKLVGDFFVFESTLRNGVFVGSGDVNGDGKSDLIFGGGPGGGPRVMILDAAKVLSGDVNGAIGSPIANFFAGDTSQRGGIRVAAKDIDGDNLADLVTGSGEGFPAHVRTYLGKDILAAPNGSEPTLLQDFSAFGGGVSAAGVFVG